MKIKELKKKEALCEIINMKFDEANELFEAETLQSMQMAQISGGTTGGPIVSWLTAAAKKIIEMIGHAANTITVASVMNDICKFFDADEEGRTPPPTATVDIKVNRNGDTSVTLNGRADSIIYTKDGGVKIYGPTSITNSANDGSTDMP